MCAGRTVPALLAASALALASPQALGQTRGEQQASVAVLGLTAPPPSVRLLPDLSAALRAAAAEARLAVPAEQELLARPGAALTEQEHARLAQARQRARELYLAFDFDATRTILEEARRELRDRFGDLLCLPELIDLDLELADLLLDLGDQLGQGGQAEAFSLLLEVARCQPGRELGPDQYGSRVVAAWAAVRSGAAPPDGTALPPSSVQRLALAGAVAGVSFVVTGELTETGAESATLRLAAIRVGSGSAPAEEEVSLGPRSSWEQTLAPAVRRLCQLPSQPSPRPPAAPPTGRILVLSTPPGARIAVDDTVVGDSSPALLTVPPGRHLVSLSLEGRQPAQVNVTVWQNQTQPVEVRLSRPRRARARRLWWLWTTIGVVAAGSVAGLIYWGVDSSRELPDATVEVRLQELTARPGPGPR